MKLILDVDDPVDYSPAMNAGMLVMQQNPNQKVGTSLSVSQQGVPFKVTRNEDSITVEYA